MNPKELAKFKAEVIKKALREESRNKLYRATRFIESSTQDGFKKFATEIHEAQDAIEEAIQLW